MWARVLPAVAGHHDQVFLLEQSFQTVCLLLACFDLVV